MLKTSASKDRFSLAQTRSGRRSMSVDTLLRKEKDGTLYASKAAEAIGVEMVDGKKRVLTGDEAKRELAGMSVIPDSVLSSLRHLLGDFGGGESTDLIPGGKADGKKPEDFDQGSLAKGQKVEYEHTDDPRIAREIAMDHLVESPEYYEALEKMEKGLEGEKSAAPRAVKLWQEAQAKGDKATMRAVQDAYGKLELSPRHLRDLGRGEEAVAMQMLGGATPGGVKVPAGTVVQKIYDPKSLISAGELTGRVLEDKQRITDVVNAAAAVPSAAAAGGGSSMNPYLLGGAILGGGALLGGAGYLGYKAYKKHQEKKQEEESKTSAAKVADSWKPQWLELPYTEGERGMQNAPVKGKSRPGDAPAASDGYSEGQRYPGASYAQPTNNAIAPKTASLSSAHLKIAAATIGRLVKSPTDTVPDVDGPQNRMKHELERLYFVQSSPDAQPLTGTASDAYQRT